MMKPTDRLTDYPRTKEGRHGNFGIMRSMGRFSDHPNALDASNRLKLAMLGWNMKVPRTASVESADTSERPYITSGILRPLMHSSNCNFVEEVDQQLEEEIDQIVPDITDSINENSWTEYNDSLTFKEKVNSDAEEYVYGYMVSKLKDKYPDIVLVKSSEQRVPESWTQTISKGGLCLPSYEWLNLFKKWEEYFITFHQRRDNNKYDLNRSEGVCAKLREILCSKFPTIPVDVIKLYVRVRTMLRIQSYNNVIKNSRFQRKNKTKEFVNSSSVPVKTETDWDSLFHAVINPEEYEVEEIVDGEDEVVHELFDEMIEEELMDLN